MKLLLVIFCICFVSCRKPSEDERVQPNEKVPQLKEKYAAKKKHAQETWDKLTGWPSPADCDGTLWAGLAKASGVDTVSLALAEHAPGEVHRRPASSGECYPEESASTVSRDMLLGYLFASWRTGDKDRVRRLGQYGEDHAWIMGRPAERVGEVLLTGNLIGLLGRMQCKMGTGCPLYAKIPPLYTKPDKDYIRHLTVLFVLLQGEVFDGLSMRYEEAVRDVFPKEVVTSDISRTEKSVLRELVDTDPADALLQSAWHLYEDGDFNVPIDMLLSEDYVYPTYVRGSEQYKLVHWLFTANLILRRYP